MILLFKFAFTQNKKTKVTIIINAFCVYDLINCLLSFSLIILIDFFPIFLESFYKILYNMREKFYLKYNYNKMYTYREKIVKYTNFKNLP